MELTQCNCRVEREAFRCTPRIAAQIQLRSNSVAKPMFAYTGRKRPSGAPAFTCRQPAKWRGRTRMRALRGHRPRLCYRHPQLTCHDTIVASQGTIKGCVFSPGAVFVNKTTHRGGNVPLEHPAQITAIQFFQTLRTISNIERFLLSCPALVLSHNLR